MPAQHIASPAIQAAVLDYFASERSEMWIAIAIFLLVVALTGWLFISSRAAFAMALLMTVVLFGGVMVAGLASL